jgi:hypothetical protein
MVCHVTYLYRIMLHLLLPGSGRGWIQTNQLPDCWMQLNAHSFLTFMKHIYLSSNAGCCLLYRFHAPATLPAHGQGCCRLSRTRSPYKLTTVSLPSCKTAGSSTAEPLLELAAAFVLSQLHEPHDACDIEACRQHIITPGCYLQLEAMMRHRGLSHF